MNDKRKRKCILAAFFILTLTGSAAVAAAGGTGGSGLQFSDVKEGQWFEPFVSQLAAEGIISGYPDGSFRPQNQVTTGQFLAMIVQEGQRSGVLGGSAMTNEDPSPATSSTAVKSHWARPFYDAALEVELLFRDELPPTSLDKPISRLWMAVISSRMMAKEEIRQNSTSAESTVQTPADIDERQPYSYEILTTYEAGLLTGYPDGTFRPEGNLTRAEAATVIYKLNMMKENVADSTDEPETPDPVFGYDPAPVDMAEGTKLFWYRLPLGDGARETLIGEADLVKLETLMNEQLADLDRSSGDPAGQPMAETLCTSFRTFAEKALIHQEEGKQGLRKEYVNGYPVLMEAVGGEIRVYVKPKGSETRFWGVEPGQVFEEFF